MTNIERPNLDQVDPAVREYVEALEAELERLRQGRRRSSAAPPSPPEPSEPPTTINVITINTDGVGKRTPRHLYSRQARGGMGVFDLETPENAPPAFLLTADESQHLVLVTDQGRGFRLPVSELTESPVRSRGQSIIERLPLNYGERLALILPDEGGTYVALLTRRGHVLWFAGHLFGKGLRSGTILYEAKKFGPPSAACWTPGDGDLFIATRQGQAIRFSTRQVPVRGCLGIRLDRNDVAVAITPVRPDSGVFLLSADGKGTIRQMSGFRANKSPGAGGKVALKTDHLIGAVTVTDDDDVFAVSRLSKLIRFPAPQVPPKEGVVQGVNCMALRADETVAMAVSPTLIPDDAGE
jgi:DNA gyrase subunit A